MRGGARGEELLARAFRVWIMQQKQASFSPPPPPPDEMVMNGCIVETNKTNVLKPILLLEKVAGK